MRLLLILLLVYLAYRVGRALLRGQPSPPAGDDARRATLDDVMIKDPVCGAYFPRREGVELRQGGVVLLFCSTTCRDRYLKPADREEEP